MLFLFPVKTVSEGDTNAKDNTNAEVPTVSKVDENVAGTNLTSEVQNDEK